MRTARRIMIAVVFAMAGLSVRSHPLAQVLPNPYRIAEGWAQLPNGRPMGAVGKVAIDPDGRHVWAIVRCERLEDPARFGDECRDSKADPILQFSPEGKVVKSWRGPVHLAARPRGRSAGQRVGDRCRCGKSDAERRQARAGRRQVQP